MKMGWIDMDGLEKEFCFLTCRPKSSHQPVLPSTGNNLAAHGWPKKHAWSVIRGAKNE